MKMAAVGAHDTEVTSRKLGEAGVTVAMPVALCRCFSATRATNSPGKGEVNGVTEQIVQRQIEIIQNQAVSGRLTFESAQFREETLVSRHALSLSGLRQTIRRPERLESVNTEW
tara:strand:- start:4752 stop:5093 length:342 start_codon:yes stop_codon:yes gene_type:complete